MDCPPCFLCPYTKALVSPGASEKKRADPAKLLPSEL